MTHGSNGLSIVVYGPRDLTEVKAGVPQVGFALWDAAHMVRDDVALAAFLNAALASSHGDFTVMERLCPRTEAA